MFDKQNINTAMETRRKILASREFNEYEDLVYKALGLANSYELWEEYEGTDYEYDPSNVFVHSVILEDDRFDVHGTNAMGDDINLFIRFEILQEFADKEITEGVELCVATNMAPFNLHLILD